MFERKGVMSGERTISAAVLRAPGEALRIERLKLRRPLPGEVLVRLAATGICHTDISGIRGNFPLPLPCVLGHEGAGHVEELGAGISDLSVGDSVVLSFRSCGGCTNCSDGHESYCDDFHKLNFSADGEVESQPRLCHPAGERIFGAFFGQSSFATHCIAGPGNVVKVDGDLPLAMLSPLGCSVQTGAGAIQNVLRPKTTDSLAILGAGAVGFSALFAARMLGCEDIVVVDRVPARLALAKELGATDVVNTADNQIDGFLKRRDKFSRVLDTTGHPPLIEAFIPAIKSRGRMALVGASGDGKLRVDIRDLYGGKILTCLREGDSNPSRAIPELVKHVRDGTFPIDRLIGYYRFDKINQAVEDAISGKTIKPVLIYEHD